LGIATRIGDNTGTVNMQVPPQFDQDAFREYERTAYSRVAGAYDVATERVTSQVHGPLLDAVGATQGTRLLDVACGPGRLSAAALQRGCLVTGIDLAQPMVALARQHCERGEFHTGDAEHLPFASARFDAVVCNLGVLHFADPEQAIREARRVLVPGGLYAFTSWVPPARNPFFGLILGAVQKHGSMDLPLPEGPPLFRFGETAECERTLRACGFEVVSTREVVLIWEFDSPDQVVPYVVSSSARMAPLLSMQTDGQRSNIEQAITDGARSYADGKRIRIPAPVVLAVARNP
jgi:ubiquinone/menaquinone biosynthesis C-methylase UbiE